MGNEELSRQRLGRGLAALIGEMDKPGPASRSTENLIAIGKLTASLRNPRKKFNDADLTDLAHSIREHGVVQPIIVRPLQDGRYEIVAGERRWRAAQRAEQTTVPVIVRDVDDRTALELAIVENVQRTDLNPVEEAAGYQTLIDEHGYTQADLGAVVGKSRSHVANTLRLLKLPDVIRDLLTEGALSAGHARTLVTALNPISLAKRIVEDGLSVRQAEALAQQPPLEARSPSEKRGKDTDTAALEKSLSNTLGLKVLVSHKASGGDVRISYRTLEQLEAICNKLKT